MSQKSEKGKKLTRSDIKGRKKEKIVETFQTPNILSKEAIFRAPKLAEESKLFYLNFRRSDERVRKVGGERKKTYVHNLRVYDILSHSLFL